MIPPRTTSALALIFTGAFAFACTNDNGGGGSEDTSREITNEELSRMVLGVTAFGREYAGFAPDETNGPQTIEQVASEEDDPAAERVDLEQFGWSGHTRHITTIPSRRMAQYLSSAASCICSQRLKGRQATFRIREPKCRRMQTRRTPVRHGG